jgi:hypothetical protein
MTVTIFTWGYYGWGNATPQLIEAVDAAETSRGFEPPFFVDIRIRRSVRAKGFVGKAFEKSLGPSRHRWMQSLGNKSILTHTGPDIQIADPPAAYKLLDLAIELADHKQRVLFFCSCQWPRGNGDILCHRCTVAELVLKAAKKHEQSVEIVEWPGGEPKQIDLEVTREVFASVQKGRKTVPLQGVPDLAQVGGLAWGSIATVRSEGRQLHRIVGPAIWQTDKWSLPVFPTSADSLPEYEREATILRRKRGLEPSSV